ncbi:MAG: phosphoglucosamine mutase [Planctomycetes bacterium]|nr:phosphoglucosamine mutase [Planctomycetota bacterium]
MGEALFGTDGVRGPAGIGLLAPDSVVRLGAALGDWLIAHGDAMKPALIGGDTRGSRDGIARSLATGLAARGIRSLELGVLPTAGLALLIDDYAASCAVVISASHNPAADNGIKIFTGHGAKFGDAEARFVEAHWRDGAAVTPADRDPRQPRDDGGERYLARLIAASGQPDLRGLVVALDLAHGAASVVGPELFRRLGATVRVMGNRPDGGNINQDCGSLHPAALARLVTGCGARFGLAVDGDADRSILVDEGGRIVDGDGILAAIAADAAERGRLPGNAVVGTVMSNFGLELFLKARGLGLVRTPVGDRHVSAALKERGLVLGGEPSGHVIFGSDLDYLGDGLYTAVRVAELLVRQEGPLSAAQRGFAPAPQCNTQVRVASRQPLPELPGFKEILSRSEERLGNQGRIVIRYSGTEPVCRVMVEGADATLVRTLTDELAGFLRRAIGAS